MEWSHPAAATGMADIACLSVLQLLNVLVGFVEEMKAASDIAKLKETLQPKCTVKRMYGSVVKTEIVGQEQLVLGDIICLGAGSAIPADCRLYPGPVEACQKPIYVDQAALTGESLPVRKSKDDTVMMNTTCVRGEAEAIVTATACNTEYGQTQKLIQDVEEPSNFEKVLYRMLIVLIATGLMANAIIMICMMKDGIHYLNILSFNVVLLIASIPVALRVVCVSTLAVGCRELAAEGAIVSRLSSIEELAGMTVLCSDKTGTLTINKMQLQNDIMVYADVLNPLGGAKESMKQRTCDIKTEEGKHILFLSALSTKWWEPAKDAIDTLVLDFQKDNRDQLDTYEHADFLPFDPSIKRTAATVRNKTSGETFSICKGAPDVLLGMCDNQEEIRESFEATVEQLASRGIRALAICHTNKSNADLEEPQNGDGWRMLGILTFLDPPR